MLYDRPLSLQQRVLEGNPERPLSAMALDFRDREDIMSSGDQDTSEDVDMQDAGPSTAPMHGSQVTFFHDDE